MHPCLASRLCVRRLSQDPEALIEHLKPHHLPYLRRSPSPFLVNRLTPGGSHHSFRENPGTRQDTPEKSTDEGTRHIYSSCPEREKLEHPLPVIRWRTSEIVRKSFFPREPRDRVLAYPVYNM